MNNPLQRLRDWRAEFAIILGSGLGSIVPSTTTANEIAYSEFGELPRTSVPGHAGRFVLGEINSVHVIFAQGRVHLYEGFSARDVTAGIRVLADAGVKNLILTNAAGSANPKFAPGTWMMITDHINLTGTSPLVLSRQEPARRDGSSAAISETPQFTDLTDVYSPHLRERFAQAARKSASRTDSSRGEIDMVLHEGVYAGLLGPQYETPAEVRMLQKLGADAVGMSTVLEAIQARALGLEVAGFSCLTNLAAGISQEKLSHDEVLKTGKNAAADFVRLINAAL
jgi:purine-nucleoside phosphorylase